MITTLLSYVALRSQRIGREKKADSKLPVLETIRYYLPKKCLKGTKMSRSSSPLVVGDGDLIIEEVPMDEDEAAMPPPPMEPVGPPNACIIRDDSHLTSRVMRGRSWQIADEVREGR